MKLYNLKRFPGYWDQTKTVEVPFRHLTKNWRLYDAEVASARRSIKRPAAAVHGTRPVVVRHHGNVTKMAFPRKVYTIVY